MWKRVSLSDREKFAVAYSNSFTFKKIRMFSLMLFPIDVNETFKVLHEENLVHIDEESLLFSLWVLS